MITQRLNYKTPVFLLLSLIMLQDLVWITKVHAGACNTKESGNKKPTSPPKIPLSGELLIAQLKEDDYQSDFLQQLIAQGADVNYEDGHHLTPLAYAIQNNHIEAVSLLLDSGVNPDCTVDRRARRSPMTALTYAAHYGRTEIIEVLINRGANLSQLNGEALINQVLKADNPRDRLQQLIAQGANVNYRSENKGGYSSLTLAIRDNHIEIASLLLQAGANPNEMIGPHETDDWVSVLDFATQMERTEIIEELINRGAKLSQLNGEALINQLLKADNPRDRLQQLIAQGANVNYRQGTQNLPSLAHAIRDNHIEIASLLLQAGADPNGKIPRSNLGYLSFLEYAAQKGRTEIIKELIKRDAKVSRHEGKLVLRNGDRYSGKLFALVLALENNHHGIFKLLLENGYLPDEGIRFNFTLNETANLALSELLLERRTEYQSEVRNRLKAHFECEGQQVGQNIIPKEVVEIIGSYL